MGATHEGVGRGGIAPTNGDLDIRTPRRGRRRFVRAAVVGGLAALVALTGCGGGDSGGSGGSGDGGADASGVPDGSSFDLEAAQPCTWVTDESLQIVFDTVRPEAVPGGLETTKTCKWEDPEGQRFLQVNVATPRMYDMTAELETTTEFEGLDRPAILSPSDINDGFMVMVKAEDHTLIIDASGIEPDDPDLLPLVQDVVARSGL